MDKVTGETERDRDLDFVVPGEVLGIREMHYADGVCPFYGGLQRKGDTLQGLGTFIFHIFYFIFISFLFINFFS